MQWHDARGCSEESVKRGNEYNKRIPPALVCRRKGGRDFIFFRLSLTSCIYRTVRSALGKQLILRSEKGVFCERRMTRTKRFVILCFDIQKEINLLFQDNAFQ